MKQTLLAAAFTMMVALNPAAGQTASAAMSDLAAGRFLDQAAWGPTPASIAQLEKMGIDAWLAAQFALNTSDLPDQPILDSAGKTNRDLTPVQRAFFANAVSGQDQLRQRVAFALSEIFVASAVQVKPAYAIPPYWRILRDNAFANYRDIIKAVTLNPAMGNYLSMANNNKGNAAKGTSANENYARELMQLFTLGLTQLRLDGSPALDANGNPVPTYDQAEVTSQAKMLTGWTYPTAPGASPKNNNPAYYYGQMIAVEAEHDTSAKTIFGGIQIPAGQTAEQDLESLLDALMAQPTMAPFVGRQLIQHLVTSNPSPAYIQRVASVFENDGAGVRGDMQAIITAVLTDPEARAGDESGAAPNPGFGHLREPVLFMANLLRGLNATLGAASTVYNDANLMGQDLFYEPSVFSYFSPLYRISSGQLGPEFQLYSTQAAAERADVVNAALYGHLDKTTTVDLTPFASPGTDISAMIDYAGYIFLHTNTPPALYEQAAAAAGAATSPMARAQAILYLVLTSSDYQVIQ
ncbi:MAG: DUF1800 domain-containing protein [Bryobacteraceae bacterium]